MVSSGCEARLGNVIFFWARIHVSMLIALGDAMAVLKVPLDLAKVTAPRFSARKLLCGGPKRSIGLLISHLRLLSPVSLSKNGIYLFLLLVECDHHLKERNSCNSR